MKINLMSPQIKAAAAATLTIVGTVGIFYLLIVYDWIVPWIFIIAIASLAFGAAYTEFLKVFKR